MTRTDIINHFIKTRGYKAYLEIGVFTGENIDRVEAPIKFGVDPVALTESVTHTLTSDEFFKTNTQKFDIVFIDGLHLSEQVDKDIVNSLKFLNKGGVVLLHDCNPPTEKHASRERTQAEWNGDVYKSFINFKNYHANPMYTIDTDWGVGVIEDAGNFAGAHDAQFKPIPDFEEFDKNRKKYLNLISVEEFLEKVK